MSTPRAMISHPQAGALRGLRLGTRAAPDSGVRSDLPIEFGPDQPVAGVRRIGALAVDLTVVDQREAATFEVRISNVGAEPIFVESVVLGTHWTPPPTAGLRYLKHGWQSWSVNGIYDLDAAGDPEFASSDWMRGLHHARERLPHGREGWHESTTLGLVGSADGGANCLVGALETGRAFCSVYLRQAKVGVEIELEQLLEVSLEPGETRLLETVRVALGPEASRLLDAFASLWGREANARTSGSFQAGWCSWYRFFNEVTEDDLLRNLDALSVDRESIGVEVVQLDDGYQHAIGDWLETNQKFSSGLPALASRIRSAGFVPGLWTAPFCVVPESRLFRSHPEWLLRDPSGDEAPFVGTFVPAWTETGGVHVLDTTREDVIGHLESVFRELVDMGFDYLKLDFLHSVSGFARACDTKPTRAQRLRRGLEAIRHGAGERAFLLGCGCPMGPAVGIVDGMRIGPDVAPNWEPKGPLLPGIEAALPSTVNAVRSILLRAFMHRRLWLNDPDCLMARREETDLSLSEAQSLATAIGVSGGMVVISDDVPELGETERQLVRDTLQTAKEVDASGRNGTSRLPDMFSSLSPQVMIAGRGAQPLQARFNLGDTPGPGAGTEDGGALPAHASQLHRISPPRPLAIFCDFDGTFSIQDVGSTLAKTHRSKERPAVQERFSRREITAWESNMELLHGLDLPEADLEAFLRTVELDPEARRLLEWCISRSIPFHILSDGFDFNLERLKQIHDVEFSYTANRLHYEAGCWQIAPGAPNPSCTCGTGVCKRTEIEAYRGQHPGAAIVHVGNGQVSDLCGAVAADIAFAKDTLAPALFARGEAYEPFEDLGDVISTLEKLGF